MSVQALNAERQIWIYTQMLRIREFEEHVKRTFTEHPGEGRGASATDVSKPTCDCHGIVASLSGSRFGRTRNGIATQ